MTANRPIACGVVALAAMLTPTVAPAQDSDTELLKAILCEVKELRAALLQGQVAAPLLEASMRERENARNRLTKLQEQHGALAQTVQATLSRQSELHEAQRTQRLAGNKDADDERERKRMRLEMLLQTTTQTLEQQQAEQARLSSQIGRLEARVAELEDEFDRMQRQLQGLAATSSTMCEPSQ